MKLKFYVFLSFPTANFVLRSSFCIIFTLVHMTRSSFKYYYRGRNGNNES